MCESKRGKAKTNPSTAKDGMVQKRVATFLKTHHRGSRVFTCSRASWQLAS